MPLVAWVTIATLPLNSFTCTSWEISRSAAQIRWVVQTSQFDVCDSAVRKQFIETLDQLRTEFDFRLVAYTGNIKVRQRRGSCLKFDGESVHGGRVCQLRQ